MDRSAALMVLYVGVSLAPVVMALMAAALSHLLRRVDTSSLPAEEQALVTRFAERRRRFGAYVAAAPLAGLAIWAWLGLPVTGIGLMLLLPVYGFLAHLRCPTCASHRLPPPPGFRHHCRYCGARLTA